MWQSHSLMPAILYSFSEYSTVHGQIQHQKTKRVDKSEQQALALKALVIQLKELYRNLALAGDAFRSFEDTIGGDVDRLDTTTHTLENTGGLMLPLPTP